MPEPVEEAWEEVPEEGSPPTPDTLARDRRRFYAGLGAVLAGLAFIVGPLARDLVQALRGVPATFGELDLLALALGAFLVLPGALVIRAALRGGIIRMPTPSA